MQIISSRPSRRASITCLVLVATGAAVAVTGPANASAATQPVPSPSGATTTPSAAPGGPLACTPALVPTVGFTDPGEKRVGLPFSLGYGALSSSDPAGQGANPSAVGYTVVVDSPSGETTVDYGTSPTDAGQGVPWSDSSGSTARGHVPAWALDAHQAGSYRVTMTYDKPVYGMRTAVTDLDVAGESVKLDAYSAKTGGVPLALAVEDLDNPDTVPALAPQQTQSGNTAYIHDPTRIGTPSANTFGNTKSESLEDARGSVYFAFDANTPVQRIEMTYTTTTTSGFWFVPPSIPQSCFQPSFSVSNLHEGDTTQLVGSLGNMAGSGRIEDIDFTYDLPDGVVVADDPEITNACGGSITAVPGATSFTVKGGALAGGAGDCRFGIDVTFTKPGTVSFDGSAITGASNLDTTGTAPTSVHVEADLPAVVATASAEVSAGADTSKVDSKATYSVVVTNTGNTPLTSFTIDDDLDTSIDCTGLPLAPGASITCVSTKPAVVTQTDVDAGTITDVIQVSAASAIGKKTSAPALTVVTAIDSSVSLGATLTGEIGDGVAQVGDEVAYALRLTNTGTTTLVSFASVTPGLDCPSAGLAPGESVDCMLPAHELDQADLDRGDLSLAVEVDAENATGSTTKAAADTKTIIETSARATVDVVAALRVGLDDRVDAGDTIGYTATVHNEGTVTLDSIAVETAAGGVLNCPVRSLAPGESLECTLFEQTITQADVDSGSATLQLSGSAVDPRQAPVTLAPVSIVTDLASQAILQTSATATLHQGDEAREVDPSKTYRVEKGDRLTFSTAITNTGNVSVESLVAFDDLDSKATCDVTNLAPGETTTCVSTRVYSISTKDIQAGFIADTLGARGKPFGGLGEIESKAPLSIRIAPVPIPAPVPVTSVKAPVEPAAPSPVELAFTGVNGMLNLVIGAGTALIGGLGLLVIGRRRRARG